MAKLFRKAMSNLEKNIRNKSSDDGSTAYKYDSFKNNKDEQSVGNMSNSIDTNKGKFSIPPTPNNSGDSVKTNNKKQNKDQHKREEQYKFDNNDEEIVVSVKINDKNQQNKDSSKYVKEDEGTLELLSYLVTKKLEEKHQQAVKSSPSVDADLLTKKLKEIQKLDRKKDENHRKYVKFSPSVDPEIEEQILEEYSQSLSSSKSSSYLDWQND